MTEPKLILVTGATGYIGGRLIPRLLDAGYRVRALVRDPQRLQGRKWLAQIEVFTGDLLAPETLPAAFKDVSVGYYLVHGMQGGKVYAERDMTAARNFANAADAANIERIIYLGELVDPTGTLSPYLRSRHETGYILRQGRVPVTEFRAGMVIGSGSVLFEMVRYLAEREPILVCPRWFYSRAQPIAVRDVLEYLVRAPETPASVGKLIEIGGANILSYAEMSLGYAKERGLKRFLIPTPFYLPRLSSAWVHMVTPVPYHAVLPLIEGLRNETIVRDESAKKLFPNIHPLDFNTALRYALIKIEAHDVETSWSDALVVSEGVVKPYTFTQEAGLMIERRQMLLDLPPEPIFRSFIGIGGERGWFYMDWAWAIRGWLDKAVGGVGLRRGRRDPDDIRVGEALDFWRVETITPNRHIRLRAEMKTPGKAWLEFFSTPQENGRTLLSLSAYFEPKGLSGFLYWYSLYVFHKFIFDGMLRNIAERAIRLSADQNVGQ
jgi:uncharacterized protein YbjT (DUF2867 family)